MQPYLDKLYRWGRKWGLEFLADKSALVMYGPSIHTLTTFYKTIVRSKIDYGIMAYGGACPITISKIDREIAPLARDIYIEDPSYSNQLKNPAPWSNLPHMTWTFPISKTEATMNQ
ncbi:hypothetical protein OUZ56_033472 [Daphnia magna]|uniref:Uncharacterized protein n=1 Tax=Daphnia magna TaxID=35525 RepID=A0ABQ9ZXW8_9CRUS|nr:hypothetical protein OUZ56_033472 [Daphnia magna]